LETEQPQQPPVTGGLPAGVAELEPLPAPRRRRPALWAASVAMVVVVVAAIAAGSGGTTWKSNRVVLSEAQARTTASGTARVTGTGTLTLNGVTRPLLQIEGQKDYANASTAMTLTVGSFTQNIRVVHGVTYLSVPGVRLPRNAHWITFTADDMKLSRAAAASVGSQDPSAGLDFLSGVSGNPRVVDHAPLDGIDVTHYAFTLDFQSLFAKEARAVKALSGSSTFATAIQKLGAIIDISAIPGEAWIDRDGRVRRFDFTLAVNESGENVKFVDDFRFSHFSKVACPTGDICSRTQSGSLPHHRHARATRRRCF